MNFLAYLSVFGMAMLKVLPAVGIAFLYKFNGIELFVTISAGSFFSVVFFAYFGARIKKWWKNRKKARRKEPQKINFRRARRVLKIWKKYGIFGIAALTPPLLTPPIGTLIAVGFGEKPRRILIFMAISILVWASLFALFGEILVRILNEVPIP